MKLKVMLLMLFLCVGNFAWGMPEVDRYNSATTYIVQCQMEGKNFINSQTKADMKSFVKQGSLDDGSTEYFLPKVGLFMILHKEYCLFKFRGANLEKLKSETELLIDLVGGKFKTKSVNGDFMIDSKIEKAKNTTLMSNIESSDGVVRGVQVKVSKK